MNELEKEIFDNLPTEIEFENSGDFLTVTCPDEDNEINVIFFSYDERSSYTLMIEEAEQLRDFLTNHLNNYYENLKLS